LTSLNNRFSWFKRLLSNFSNIYFKIFPEHWKVEYFFSKQFCEWIYDELQLKLRDFQNERIKEELVLQALMDCSSFDRFLNLRFKTFHDIEVSGFSLSRAFQPYYFYYFDKKLDDFTNLMKSKLPLDLSTSSSINSTLSKTGDKMYFNDFDKFFIFFDEIIENFTFVAEFNPTVLVQISFYISRCLENLKNYLENQIEK
jgi:hypothetical protein